MPSYSTIGSGGQFRPRPCPPPPDASKARHSRLMASGCSPPHAAFTMKRGDSSPIVSPTYHPALESVSMRSAVSRTEATGFIKPLKRGISWYRRTSACRHRQRVTPTISRGDHRQAPPEHGIPSAKSLPLTACCSRISQDSDHRQAAWRYP